MTVDYIFITPNMYEGGDVLPEDCTKEPIDLGAVPNEVCDIYGPPSYNEYMPKPTPVEDWFFGNDIPIVFA